MATFRQASKTFLVMAALGAVGICDGRRQVSTKDEITGDLNSLNDRLHNAKMELWARGLYYYGNDNLNKKMNDDQKSYEQLVDEVQRLEKEVFWSPMKLGPVRKVRVVEDEGYSECMEWDCPLDLKSQNLFNIRGGAMAAHDSSLVEKLSKLGEKFGDDFKEAILRNEREHAEDCAVSCESFYCAPKESALVDEDSPLNGTSFASYSFGATPPEDFASLFGFPLDLIKVTQGNPLFSAEEAAEVVSIAEEEGVDKNEYKSGKYKLGGDWLVNLPNTREWFNRRLESTFFPLISNLFPEIVSSPSVLRAHSVSLLKYNSSHPRTDVHVDNGILAMTLAMTPKDDYVGGGTFFEHMGDDVIPMDVGHGTFRPGSVRHGGHKVTKGTRYILGAFLLIEDRVEHVRRLKNRGSELRRIPDLEGAAKHFEWALALNPKCTTCLKDWAEILLTQKRYDEAEAKLRRVLELLEEKDSDALFSLGVILSEAGKDDESIEAYTKSVKLNAEDAELCYNLGIKLGAKGDVKAEMAMYARATNADPSFGGAWLNWGTALAESGNLEDVSTRDPYFSILCTFTLALSHLFNLHFHNVISD